MNSDLLPRNVLDAIRISHEVVEGAHPWVSTSGRPWSLRVKSDYCRDCGTTPDDHKWICANCGFEWPCITARLVAHIDAVAAEVEQMPNSGGGHWDQWWSDAYGFQDSWHECASGSGISRASVTELLLGRIG